MMMTRMMSEDRARCKYLEVLLKGFEHLWLPVLLCSIKNWISTQEVARGRRNPIERIGLVNWLIGTFIHHDGSYTCNLHSFIQKEAEKQVSVFTCQCVLKMLGATRCHLVNVAFADVSTKGIEMWIAVLCHELRK